MKPPGLTRRTLAIYAAPVLLASTAKAQAPPAPVRSSLQNAAQQLAAVKLPRNIEPASRFEA
jgi:hypothetical protein